MIIPGNTIASDLFIISLFLLIIKLIFKFFRALHASVILIDYQSHIFHFYSTLNF